MCIANYLNKKKAIVNELYIYRAIDDNEIVGLRFLNNIHVVCDALVRYIQNTNIPMTTDDIRNYESSEKCYCCYNQYRHKKCTYDGKYVSSVCMECDVKMRKKGV